MSGWDMSSTPTWGPNEGPEESTQSFPVPGTGTRDLGQDFDGQDSADAGPSAYPKRTPGQSMRDLPRRESRGRHSAPAASYGSDNAYGTDNGFGQDKPFGQDNPFGQDIGFGQDEPFGQDKPFGQDTGFGQDIGFGQDKPFGQDTGFGQDKPFGQDSGFGADRDRGAAPAPARTPDWGTGPDAGQNWAAPAPAPAPAPGDDGGWGRPAGRSVPPWEERLEPDFGVADRQESARHEPGRPGYRGPGDFPGDPGFPGQQEPGFPGRDSDARMDPALQDFFAPQAGRQDAGRREPGLLEGGRFEGRPGPGPSGSGPSGPGLPDPGQPGQPGPRRGAPNPYAELEPARIGQPSSRYRQTDGWGEADGRPAPSRGGSGGGNGTGPRPASGGARHQQGGGLSGGTVTIGLAVIVIAVVAVGAYLLLGHGSSNKPTASASTGTPTHATKAPTKKASSKATSKAKGGGTTAAARFTLSTPATAGGYPQGKDPHFLAAATATAKSIANAVASGGAGTPKGNPVSAAYQLPNGGQVLTFVGYQGTFSPKKVATILASLGSDEATYPAGPNGGTFGCGNTPASASAPSGAVCVWSTGSTLGITEFFSSTGPEALTASQSKGAADALKLRNGVEAKKKSS